ncbi:MAG TPA: DNA translocase FtsK 4TM domain-containing protein, partial [Gemmataceae bacterium]
MPDRRQWRLYLAACILLAGGVFLTFSVLDCCPTGPLGAGLAHELRQSLGAAVYVFLAGWFVVVIRLVLRRSWLSWLLRSLGWLLLVPSMAVLAERWPDLVPPSAMLPLGPGGSIGAWLNDWLQTSFPPIGQDILLGSCAALGVLLSLDAFLLRLLRLLWWCIRANLDITSEAGRRSAERPRSSLPIVRKVPPTEAEEPELDEEPTPDAPPVEEPVDGRHVIPIHHHNEISRHEAQGPHLFAPSRRKPAANTPSDR